MRSRRSRRTHQERVSASHSTESFPRDDSDTDGRSTSPTLLHLKCQLRRSHGREGTDVRLASEWLKVFPQHASTKTFPPNKSVKPGGRRTRVGMRDHVGGSIVMKRCLERMEALGGWWLSFSREFRASRITLRKLVGSRPPYLSRTTRPGLTPPSYRPTG